MPRMFLKLKDEYGVFFSRKKSQHHQNRGWLQSMEFDPHVLESFIMKQNDNVGKLGIRKYFCTCQSEEGEVGSWFMCSGDHVKAFPCLLHTVHLPHH